MFSMSTMSSRRCNNSCAYAYGSIYSGDNTNPCVQCPAGPTGPPGDRYLSYFTETFYSNRLFNGARIGIKIDPYLAYVPTDTVFIQVVATDTYPTPHRFYATVVSYDSAIGIILLNNISGISPSFPFGQSITFIINLYNYIAGPTGASMTIGPSGTGSMVITNPSDTTAVNYTNMVTVDSSSVAIQGYSLKLLTGLQEHVGYIDYTPYQLTNAYNVYYITKTGDCTIILPRITSINDGFYIYLKRVYYDTTTVAISSGLVNGVDPPNIIHEGQHITDAGYDYSCQLVGNSSVRTFRVGTINGISYWFANTA